MSKTKCLPLGDFYFDGENSKRRMNTHMVWQVVRCSRNKCKESGDSDQEGSREEDSLKRNLSTCLHKTGTRDLPHLVTKPRKASCGTNQVWVRCASLLAWNSSASGPHVEGSLTPGTKGTPCWGGCPWRGAESPGLWQGHAGRGRWGGGRSRASEREIICCG